MLFQASSWCMNSAQAHISRFLQKWFSRFVMDFFVRFLQHYTLSIILVVQETSMSLSELLGTMGFGYIVLLLQLRAWRHARDQIEYKKCDTKIIYTSEIYIFLAKEGPLTKGDFSLAEARSKLASAFCSI
ncbi:hypothetical protein CEXT_252971 [Caerostris extrusa]|uniref:Uncharacterized protein n=1 Tax=Caerostris extrusa TaxID=172846 RepID=A0AAV4XT64_CAEEX|nr:hypothetical protein CEXT_252971 [Caerostris extrusa]